MCYLIPTIYVLGTQGCIFGVGHMVVYVIPYERVSILKSTLLCFNLTQREIHPKAHGHVLRDTWVYVIKFPKFWTLFSMFSSSQTPQLTFITLLWYYQSHIHLLLFHDFSIITVQIISPHDKAWFIYLPKYPRQQLYSQSHYSY